MYQKIIRLLTAIALIILTGCASVPMANADKNVELKKFNAPPENKAGLYIFRNTFLGKALKKTVTLDGAIIGETANKVYFYRAVEPGKHTISTESEFSDNITTFEAISGKNYFAEQFIKMGAFVGGASIRMIDDEVGKKNVLECNLAEENPNVK